MKNKSDSGQESQATELTSMELKSLSEDILGFNVWEDESGIFVKVNNEWVIDAPEERELNHGEINERIQNIIKDYENRNSDNIKEGKARIELKNYKGFVVEISSYLTPIMQGILSSYEKIPWIYGKESLHNEFSYSCLVAEGVPEEDWRNLEILTKVLDYQKLNCFCEEKFLENYYLFFYKTLCKVPDEDTKYLVFYAMEKIYSLELFEIETRKLYNYINDKDVKEDEEKKEELRSILNKIFQLNGARGKIKLAEQVLDSFSENIDSSTDDLMDKIDDIFDEYEENFIFVKKDEVFKKSELEAEIKECGKKEWEWYNDRHRKALMFKSKYKEWEKEYFLPEEMKNVMIFVMQSSIGYSLDFEFDFSDGHKIWGEKDNEPIDFLRGVFEDEECADDNLME